MDNTRCLGANTFLWYVIVFKLCMNIIIQKIIIFNPIIHYLVGLQTKGKFACPVCGPKMKSRHSKSLGKQVFDEYRHFLHKNHKYRNTEKHLFNGKEENTSKPQRMTPHLWKLEYNRINHQGNAIPSIGLS